MLSINVGWIRLEIHLTQMLRSRSIRNVTPFCCSLLKSQNSSHLHSFVGSVGLIGQTTSVRDGTSDPQEVPLWCEVLSFIFGWFVVPVQTCFLFMNTTSLSISASNCSALFKKRELSLSRKDTWILSIAAVFRVFFWLLFMGFIWWFFVAWFVFIF